MQSATSTEKESENTRLVAFSTERSTPAGVHAPSLMKKLYRHVLPACLLILIFCNIDRGNLGFVANELCKDMKLTHTEYGTGASVFFAGIVFSRIPSNIALRYFGAPLWLMTIMFAWGICAALLGLITHVHHFYVLRFLLGLAEGGAFPGVWYYVTEFFPDDSLTIPYTVTALALPIAFTIAGPLTAGFLMMDGLFGVASWRSLFIFEGLVPAIVAPIMFCYLPKDIDSASFLTSDEREWLQRRRKPDAAREHSFWTELVILSKNHLYWLQNLFAFVHLGVFAVIMYWTTLMVGDVFTSEEGKDDDTCASSRSNGAGAVLVTALIFIVASVSTLLVGLWTRKSTNRHLIAGWGNVVCGVALASWTVAGAIHADMGLVSLTVAACAINAPSPQIVALFVSHFDARIKATALSTYSTVAAMGGFVLPIVVGAIVDHYDSYNMAALMLGILSVASSVLLLFVTDPLKKQSIMESTG